MRISTLMTYNQATNNINTLYEKLYSVNEKISTSKKINKPSDDPIGSSKVLNYRDILSTLEQYQKNIDAGLSWLQSTESALSQAEEVITEAKTLAEQMATGTYDEEERETMSVQAEQLYDQLMQIGNTEVAGRYIFSGYMTDTKPFTRDEDYTISYNGDTNEIKLTVQQDMNVTINTTGQEAFLEDINVFDVLKDLRTALAENDQDATGDLLPTLDDALNQFAKELAYVGTSVNQMESSQTIVEDLTYGTTTLLSATEDTDVVDATSQLATLQVALEAALKCTSMISGLSLVNYL